MKKFLILAFALLMLSARLPAQNTVTATLSAAGSNCLITNVCQALPTPNMGSVTFTVSANASSNTIQFEGTANGGTTWVALDATPSNSTTPASSTTSTGTWQANIGSYTAVRMRMSTKVGGTTTVTITTSAISARASGANGITGTITDCTTTGGVAYENGTSDTLTCGNLLVFTPASPAGEFVLEDTSPCALTPIVPYTICSSTTNNNETGQEEVIGNATNLFGATCWTIPTDTGNTGTTRGSQACAGVEASGAYSGMLLTMLQNGRSVGGLTLQGANGAVPGAEEVGVYGILNNATLTEWFITPDAGIQAIIPSTFSLAPYTTNINPLGDATHKWANVFTTAVNTDSITSGVTGYLIYSATAPSVAANGCGTTGASIVTNNGTASFKVNVGTTNGGTCTITMPAATTDWVCFATDITTISTTVSQTRAVPTSGHLTTEITLSNYTDISGAHAWVDSDVIEVSCQGE